ncbi:MAG: sigma-70 family RNA polymerase sigma factor [Armatimonadota bacterium]
MSASLAVWQSKDVSGVPLAAGAENGALLTERDLIARSCEGDRAAFEQLYVLYATGIYRCAYRLLEDADEADDIRQETFVRAYQSLARFRGEAGFRTYLLTICSNLCRDRMRQRQRRPVSSYGLAPSEFAVTSQTLARECTDPLSQLEQADQAERVWRALHRLPVAPREILLLRHVEGLEIEEIAQIVGCTKISVPVRLFRARRQFKDLFLALLREEGE